MSKYVEYELTSDILCIGERVKKGIYKPCIKTIPFSTITGALRDTFNSPTIYALGKLDADYLKNIDQFRQIHIYSPRYVFEDVSKVPLKIEFITDVKAKVYVFLKEGSPERFIEKKENRNFDIIMGAFKSKGFGKCHLRLVRIIENPETKIGKLQTRIPDTDNCKRYFGIKNVKKNIYGYLFEPTTKVSGKYVRALYEGSVIEGCDFLVEEDCDERP